MLDTNCVQPEVIGLLQDTVSANSFLFAAANLPVGSDIKVEFKNPTTDEPVRVRGKVRNRTVYLYGVEFLSNELKIDGNWRN